jgi:beta-N-acetylglucosaminidase
MSYILIQKYSMVSKTIVSGKEIINMCLINNHDKQTFYTRKVMSFNRYLPEADIVKQVYLKQNT